MGSRVWSGIGSSMLPSIPPGSKLTLTPVEGGGRALEVGDVAVYLGPNGGFVAHRVIAVKQGPTGALLETRGDNQELCDLVPASAVAFRVTLVGRGPVSYSTDGPLGRIIASAAVRGGWPWRAVQKAATRALGLAARFVR